MNYQLEILSLTWEYLDTVELEAMDSIAAKAEALDYISKAFIEDVNIALYLGNELICYKSPFSPLWI